MLSKEDLKYITKATPHYCQHSGRDIIKDIEELYKDPRIEGIELRKADKKRGHQRDYLVFHTDPVYYYSSSGKKRSKLGEFEIHLPLDQMLKTVQGYAELPGLESLEYSYGDMYTEDQIEYGIRKRHGGKRKLAGGRRAISTSWGGGMVFKGKFKPFKDHTGEGFSFGSYHPHVYGKGVMLCLGGFYPAIIQAGDHDLIAFMETVFKFLEQGGRHGDEGDGRRVSMYSGCVKEIFDRHSEKVTARSKRERIVTKDQLLKGLG